MTETVTELKPCPFCGGSNVSVSGPYGWYRQFCITHSCRTFYSGAQEIAQGFHSKADAVAAWNTRASQPVEPKGPFATHGSGAALNTGGGQTYAMSTPPLDSEAVERVDLQMALDLALGQLSEFEPGDSRAVSDEFVAMAAIACGVTDNLEGCRSIIRAALTAMKGNGDA